MKRVGAVIVMLWAVLWAGMGIWGACPANNPVSNNAIPIQGPDPSGNLGYPIAVVGAAGCPLDVNVAAFGASPCVTQCTSPWTVADTPSTDTTFVAVLNGAGQTLTMPCQGYRTLTFFASPNAAWNANLQVEAQDGLGDWTAVPFLDENENFVLNPTTGNGGTTTGINASYAAFPAIFGCGIHGYKQVRLKVVSYTAGSISIEARLSMGTPPVFDPTLGSVGDTATGPSSFGTVLSKLNYIGAQLSFSIQPNSGGPFNTSASSISSNSFGYLFDGTSWIAEQTATIYVPLNAVGIAAETTVYTPPAGKRFRLMGYHLAASVAGNVVIRDNTAGVIITVIPSAAGGSGTYVDLKNGIRSGGINNVLTAQGPALDTLSGVLEIGVE